jgi:hypothetical protein
MTDTDGFPARLRAGARLDELMSSLDTDRVVSRSRHKRTARRTALGALGVVGLATAAALAAPALDGTSPVPPAVPSTPTAGPTPTAGTTPAPSSSPDPTALPAGFQTGHVPAWLSGSRLACGADVAALSTATGDLTLHAAGTSTTESTAGGTWLYTLPASLASSAPATVNLWAPQQAAVAWVQDGRIVGVGPNQAEMAAITPLAPGTPHTVSAAATRTDYCVPDTDGTYTTDLPPGHYQLVLYLPVSPTTYDPSTITWLTSQPLTATLTSDGQLTDVRQAAS